MAIMKISKDENQNVNKSIQQKKASDKVCRRKKMSEYVRIGDEKPDKQAKVGKVRKEKKSRKNSSEVLNIPKQDLCRFWKMAFGEAGRGAFEMDRAKEGRLKERKLDEAKVKL